MHRLVAPVFLILLSVCFASVDPFIQNYIEKRDNFLKRQYDQHFESRMTLSPKEEILNTYLQSYIQSKISNLTSSHSFPPSKYFYDAQQIIEEDSFFAWLKQMPKGGVLHLHSSSYGSIDWVVTDGISIPNCYVYWQDDGSVEKGTINFYNESNVPEGYTSVSDLRSQYSDFNSQLRGLFVSNSSYHNYDSFQVWELLEPKFSMIGGFTSYLPALQGYLFNAFEIFANDNVQHAEIRILLSLDGLGSLYDLDGNTYVGSDVVQIYEDVLAEFQQEYPHFTAKLIIASIRSFSNSTVEGNIEDAFIMRKANPDFVRGFDLVAEEDPNYSTLHYLSVWATIPSLMEKYEITMPLYFHDGESDFANNTNVVDAVLLGSKRVGHGFNTFYFPLVKELMKIQGTCIEVCPISNQILRYVDDLRIHPAAGYINEGVPIVISSDDPGVFGYEGLSYDYYEATLAWQLDLRQLKQLAYNSLHYSALEGEEKQTAIEIWQTNWEIFVTKSLSLIKNNRFDL